MEKMRIPIIRFPGLRLLLYPLFPYLVLNSTTLKRTSRVARVSIACLDQLRGSLTSCSAGEAHILRKRYLEIYLNV